MNKMFSEIAENYDTMNHILSFGVDKIWRSIAAKEAIIGKKNYKILDVATGTCDLAIRVLAECEKENKKVMIIGQDPNKDMLNVARAKVEKYKPKITLKLGTAESLKFKNNYFEIVTSSFALRDFDSLETFIKESYRVLKPGGKIILMDMAAPEGGFAKLFFNIYYHIMLFEGMFVNKGAYTFLVSSIKKFDKNNLLNLLKKHKFKQIKLTDLPSKIAFLVTAIK
jgi:demethylmenaquinone methyltransferase / 2-methoxy-6-polyprenyl-1,4-benzoquinol methylase